MPCSPRVGAALIAAATSSGCGALFNEQTRVVTIDSSPQGAEVQIDGQKAGKTPLQVTLNTAKTTTVVVEKPGYGSQICTVQAAIEPLWVVLDIWFLVPLVVDAATGRWNDVPSTCTVAFGSHPAAPEPNPDETPRPKPPTDPKPAPDSKQDPKPQSPPTNKPFPFPK